jgi:hypothetical protein
VSAVNPEAIRAADDRSETRIAALLEAQDRRRVEGDEQLLLLPPATIDGRALRAGYEHEKNAGPFG